MRIKITFKLPRPNQVLPLNYQYPLSAWIYRVLRKGDREFAELLHEAGYQLDNRKRFKLFTFSNLRFNESGFRILKGTDRMEIQDTSCSLIIAFMIPDALQNFVTGLFKDQNAEIGDRISNVRVQVGSVEMVPEPDVETKSVIRALSPVVVAKNDETDRHEQYLAPDDEDYKSLFFKNLIDKHHAWQRQTNQDLSEFDHGELQFRCLTKKPKSRLQTIKAFTPEEVKVRGYLFEFEISAPTELIRTGLNSGFGAMNAVGFGCGEVKDH